MALTPFILQGSAACAAMIERVLTTLLRHQVRRYGADRLASFSPRNSRSIDRRHAANTSRPARPEPHGVRPAISFAGHKQPMRG
jgi:hypothetical protein